MDAVTDWRHTGAKNVNSAWLHQETPWKFFLFNNNLNILLLFIVFLISFCFLFFTGDNSAFNQESKALCPVNYIEVKKYSMVFPDGKLTVVSKRWQIVEINKDRNDNNSIPKEVTFTQSHKFTSPCLGFIHNNDLLAVHYPFLYSHLTGFIG